VLSDADSVHDRCPVDFFWHFVNIPRGATRDDRDRDYPRQPAVGAGALAALLNEVVITSPRE
jgi:hypothetical protein